MNTADLDDAQREEIKQILGEFWMFDGSERYVIDADKNFLPKSQNEMPLPK